jgi:baseplate J-like protein
MAGGIIYLDIDDEITSAAARVRSSDARRVALVLPYGSRVATSRINFRLLSRDALINEKQLAVVAGDPATRALAASAGLPVFSSVGEYESSFAGLEPEPETPDDLGSVPTSSAARDARRPSPEQRPGEPNPPAAEAVEPRAVGRPDGEPAGRAASTSAEDVGAGGAAGRGRPANPPILPSPPPATNRTSAMPPWEPPNRGGQTGQPTSTLPALPRPGRPGARLPLVIALAVLGLVVLVGGVGAYVLLPSASIVVTPRPEALQPLTLDVKADPAATEPDPAALVIPAVTAQVPVTVTDTFPATGKRVEETRASGQVRFSNLDFLRTNTVPGGSIVSTNAGVRFRTNSTITVPKADLVGLTVFPGRATVGVTAVDPGTAANVEPNTIVIVPRGEDPQALKVVNPDATSGGTHDEFPKVAQADVDAALKQLSKALDAAFQDRLADPSLAAPGATVFRETAVLGDSTPSTDPATLVDQEITAFQLGLSATGTVITVDPSPISSIAEQRFRSTVLAGHELVAGSIKVSVGAATVAGQVVTFPATATGQQIAVLDPVALKRLVMGKSLADARTALAAYGNATVTAWPDWVGTIPTIDSRVSLSIQGSVPIETPEPSASPS